MYFGKYWHTRRTMGLELDPRCPYIIIYHMFPYTCSGHPHCVHSAPYQPTQSYSLVSTPAPCLV
ncbi:uncharacterized protein BJ212DRAFT_1374373 [Suillus subaureus]|uniref:Uncharacterized protein n=1 Tax=Suillus subaureus TaxID=48587 RepID=A0A9P7E593_9AGAM|nr:uncharacterized protein BJ212DRAFT_1374373 [Suillus subaureus]KAG1811422.1 hypothetical protein BJ212DRAFT_1374373 [Suillus subaureus]